MTHHPDTTTEHDTATGRSGRRCRRRSSPRSKPPGRRSRPGTPTCPTSSSSLASGSVGAPRGALKLGHFAAMRWTHADAATTGRRRHAGRPALPEVFVGGEGLALGAVDVLGTLLHEATHALAHVRGIRDTSRQGRYHNRRFRDLATEVGLEVREVPVIGWSDTHVPDTTRDRVRRHRSTRSRPR